MNKNVVILGASQGIGAALVDHFAQLEDTTVIALSRNLDKMRGRFLQKNVSCYQLDISKDVHQQIAALGFASPIDILINNAGLLINKPFEQLSHHGSHTSFAASVGC
jgi:short-subunit dehydrogenase